LLVVFLAGHRTRSEDTVDHEAAVATAKRIAAEIVAPGAEKHDRDASFPSEAIAALGKWGLLGLAVPKERGGQGLGPRTVAEVTATLSSADASVGMIFTMHTCGVLCIVAAPATAKVEPVLRAIVEGTHLTTLAFSEKGSRSHFWAPISKARAATGGVELNALKSWVTSAGHADSYVVSTLSRSGRGPTDSTLYLVPKGAQSFAPSGRWDGMGLRANASAPMTLEGCVVTDDARLTEEGAGFKAMLEVVLPFFNLGSTAVALGICRAAVGATVSHLKTATFEHMGAKLGEALPTIRATLANMQIETDSLGALMNDVVAHLERTNEATMLRVLESKAAAGETAIRVTSEAMRACGGAAFSRHTGVERFFRDAHAGAVMAPTVEVLREFIGKALLGIPLF
jgi:alkylation response protein AidB-like acyl-CoA dehydrogenase